jgi:hypothetical protein
MQKTISGKELYSLAETYLSGEETCLGHRLDSLRALRGKDEAAGKTLDAIQALLLWRSGRTKEAGQLWTNVLLSNHASNADKLLAYIGRAMHFARLGDRMFLDASAKEANILTVGFDANPWHMEGLKCLLPVLIDNALYDYVGAFWPVVEEVALRLGKSKEKDMRKLAKRQRGELGLMLVSKVLSPLGRAAAAEDELRWKVVPNLHEAGRNIDLAYAYSLLSSIRLGEGDAAGNLAYERNRWEALFPHSWQVPEMFVVASFDLMIAAGLNGMDGRDCLLSMFREWSSNVTLDIDHFPEIKAELEK